MILILGSHHDPFPWSDPHDCDPGSQVGSTSIKLQWEQPDHSGENIISYEMYWNDTYTPTVLSYTSLVLSYTPTVLSYTPTVLSYTP